MKFIERINVKMDEIIERKQYENRGLKYENKAFKLFHVKINGCG